MEKVLERVDRFKKKCQHNKFIVDQELATVECGLCGEKLNPIWALGQLCDKEGRAHRTYERVKKLTEILDGKTKCKCKNCGKITPIASYKEENKAW